jgi:hypothetical protein
MLDQVNATPTPHKRLPWDKGKLTGAKPPLRPKHVWSIWTTLQIEGRARDLTMFNLAIGSKLRGRMNDRFAPQAVTQEMSVWKKRTTDKPGIGASIIYSMINRWASAEVSKICEATSRRDRASPSFRRMNALVV